MPPAASASQPPPATFLSLHLEPKIKGTYRQRIITVHDFGPVYVAAVAPC